MEATHRRINDVSVKNRIVLWGAVAAAGLSIWTAIGVSNKAIAALDMAPQTARRVSRMDVRLQILEWYIPAMAAKMGIPPPPKADFRQRDRDDEDAN